MKNRLSTLLLFILFGFTASAQNTLSLDVCYQLATENYPLIKQYQLIEQSEGFTIARVASGNLPQITISGKASYQSEVTKLPIAIPNMTVPVMSKNQYQVNAELYQNIWDGGVLKSQLKQTKSDAQAERKQIDVQLYLIRERVNQLFFGILLQQELLIQNQALLSSLETNLQTIEALKENGMANETDLYALKVELLNGQQRTVELESRKEAYTQMLALMIGKNSAQITVLEKPPLIREPDDGTHFRPEMTLFDAQKEALSAKYGQLSSNLKPRFGFFAQGGYGRPALNMLADDFNFYYLLGLKMSWSLGGYYTRKSDRKKIDTALQTVEVNRNLFLFNNQLEKIQQDKELLKLANLISTDLEIARLRTQIRKSTESKLQHGTASAVDVIREINSEDVAKQKVAIRQIEQLLALYTSSFILNN